MPSIKKPNRMRKCAKKLDMLKKLPYFCGTFPALKGMERGNLKKTNNYDKGRTRK